MHGDSQKDYCIAFIVVDPDQLAAFAQSKNVSTQDALNGEEFKMAIYDEMMALAKDNKFNSLEKPKQVMLLEEPFSVENDMLTPTFKLKRNIAKTKYTKEISQLYAAPPMVVKK